MRSITAVVGLVAVAFVLSLTPLLRGQGNPAAGTTSVPGPARGLEKKAGAGKVYGEWSIAIKPDKGTEYNRLIEREGLPLFREAGGRMVGWWTTMIGDLYEQVTIWEYDDLAAYEKAGQILGKDDRFARFAAQRDPLLAGERSRFLKLAEGAIEPTLPERAKVVVHEVHHVPFDRTGAYLAVMRDQLAVLKKHGFRPVGPLETAVGRSTEVTYLFTFDSLAERDRLIAEFSSHKDGQTYNHRITGFTDDVTTRILTPAPHAR